MAEAAADDETRELPAGPERLELSDMDDRTRPLAHAGQRAELPSDPVEVIGRFLVLSMLGTGGMGTVYLAYDPQLDRRVAIKLLHSRTRLAEERLLREAQALARLDHANVVKIYDVGHWRGQVFLAMDYVEGGSLREWLRGEPHDHQRPQRAWQTVLDVLMQAGRGLEAAHAAGLVHRDFKPSNVLVRERGGGPRVLVIDFGLAKPLAGADASSSSSELEPITGRRSSDRRASASSAELTRSGTVVGTPAYMAPEQHRGGVVDARSDQFGFCVTLFEALWGRRPHRGATIHEVAESITSGRIEPPPRPLRRWDPEQVPHRLWRVVARGLASDPEQRWPDMATLLSALEAEVEQRSLGRVFGGSALALIGGGLAFALAQRPEPLADPCTGFESQVAAVWSSARADALRARSAALGSSWASDASGIVASELDVWTSHWVRERSEVCRASRRAELGETQLAARVGCYESRLAELDALVELLLAPAAGRERLANVDALLAALPELTSCRAGLVASAPAQPELSELRVELTTLHYLYVTGEYELVEQRVTELAPRVAASGDPTLRIELLRVQGQIDTVRGRYDSAELAYEDALWQAIALGRDDLAISTLGALATLVADQAHAPERARTWLRHAAALIERHPELGAQVEADHAYDVAVVEFAAGNFERARAAVERTLDIQADTLPPEHADLVDTRVLLGAIMAAQGDYVGAQAEFERALADVERRWGTEHPLAADLHNNLAVALIERGEVEAAIAHVERSVALRRSLYGDAHPERMQDESNLAGMLSEAGRFAAADEHFALAFTIADASVEPRSLARVTLLTLHASHLERLAHVDESITERRAAIDLLESSPEGDRVWAAEQRCAIGRAELERGRFAAALVELERCEQVMREHGNAAAHASASRSLAEALRGPGGPRPE
jgi:tetratricopeptide (TPR) repeat protein/predicted Ser/Thr protein kinase